MSPPRLIKRYANRKMYDTERSRYVTLTEVAEMVRSGEDVKVIDNKTKDDLTEVTLTQALLDSERRQRGSVSLTGLRSLINTGGDFLQVHIAEPVVKARTDAERTVEKWKSEAEKQVGRVLQLKHAERDSAEPKADSAARSQLSESSPDRREAPPPSAPDAPPGAAQDGTAPRRPRGPKTPSLVAQTQRAYDDIQHRIDERVRLVVSALTQTSQTEGELVALRAEVAALRARVEQLEAAQRAE